MEFHHTSASDSWNPLSPREGSCDPFEEIGEFGYVSPNGYSKGVHGASRLRPSARAHIDWVEKPDLHIFKVDLPGMKEDDIQVEVEEGRILKISGDRDEEHLSESDKWHQHERSYGHFLRRFRLPANADTDQVQAKLESGVLKLTIPKSQ